MTAPGICSFSGFDTPRRRVRPQWRRALRALRRLLADPGSTENAFEVIEALDPDLTQRGLCLMLSHPVGRRVFRERPSLLDRLLDRRALAQLPEGSLGRAYLAHIERFHLEPAKLVGLGRRNAEQIHASDADLCWFAERSELSHDLHHVLTGYGADRLGETALLWFSFGFAGGRANAMLMIGAALQCRRHTGPGWSRYLWLAWRRGRRAACLAALPWEDLLAAPLDAVRSLAHIEPPELVHPNGVRADAEWPLAG